jgi:hypothetical protein
LLVVEKLFPGLIPLRSGLERAVVGPRQEEAGEDAKIVLPLLWFNSVGSEE